MTKVSQIYDEVVKKTNNGTEVPIVDKNGVAVHRLTIFEDIVLRNLDNLDAPALEIVGSDSKMTYLEFFKEVEKYMSAFRNMGLKEHDVVSLCLPVGIEFICAYYALTTLGVTVNALNIMFLFQEGIEPYLSKRCSDTLIVDENYLKILQTKGAFNDANLKNLIVTGDATYTHHLNSDKYALPAGLKGVNVLSFADFLKTANMNDELHAAEYNEDRISTLNYTSGTTGRPKCMGHSDLAPLFLVSAHDTIKRDEYRGDRTLVTIPLQHPTGLFYSMVFQMAQGKILVLEPRYDKSLFAKDIKENAINHAVQAKPFYAQLVQDRADGTLKPGDFELFRNAYSGGEGIPLAMCKDINDTLAYAGCPNPYIYLGYGRSEEGSLTVTPYNLEGRANTVGVPLPGNKAKLVEAGTLKDIPNVPGAQGEILVSTPVHPIHHCYLDDYNKEGKSDGSIIDKDGVRWARAEDIASLVELPDGTLSFIALGRAKDSAKKNGETYYLFNLKEQINAIPEVQECEVLSIPNNGNDYITVHIVLKEEAKNRKEDVIRKIYAVASMIDGVKYYDVFGINATSGKCDREAMSEDLNNYYSLTNGQIIETDFVKTEGQVLKRFKK